MRGSGDCLRQGLCLARRFLVWGRRGVVLGC